MWIRTEGSLFGGSSSNGERERQRKKKPGMTLNIPVGSMIPDFELNSLSGEPVKLSDYRGKRLVIFFWASW